VFWTKIALVTLLLVNGALLQHTESTLRRATADAEAAEATSAAAAAGWQRIRRFSVMSVVLWIATFLAGSILTNAT
jgi:preprotein translocase subunit SecG